VHDSCVYNCHVKTFYKLTFCLCQWKSQFELPEFARQFLILHGKEANSMCIIRAHNNR